MLLRDSESSVFKQWLLPKLETISDADAEVLADYVIALVTTNDSEANIRQNCIESLSDFLQDHTGTFVDEVLSALRSKTYLGRAHRKSNGDNTAPIPSILDSAGDDTKQYSTNEPPANAPKGPTASTARHQQHFQDYPAGQSHISASARSTQEDRGKSRKRKQGDRDVSEPRDGHEGREKRQNGTSRHSRQTTRRTGGAARPGNAELVPQAAPFVPMPNFPPPPPGMPPFDITDPMALMAMFAAFTANFPGMPQLPIPGAEANSRKEKCRDYYSTGYCAAGFACPYEHDQAVITVPDPEYDPTQALPGFQQNGVANGGRNGHRNGGRARAPFSLAGPSHDTNNVTLVAEQLPSQRCKEEDVREFFAEFGPIEDVKVQPSRRLAIIKFEDHASAKRAYLSPKAVFDNRFVKVFWHKTQEDFDMEKEAEDKPLDLEAIAKRQAEAQKAFEERRRRQEEADARAAEIEEQIREKDEEIRSIRRQLAALAGEDDDEDYSRTLAALQAEAENLFAQKESSSAARGYHRPSSIYSPYHARGRGSYRGRGGAFRGVRSGVKRLDNRPRRIAVANITNDPKKEEALRQYLVNTPECTIDPHPDNSDSLILTFQERYQAEMFLDASLRIPDMGGPLDVSWVPNPAVGFAQAKSSDDEADGASDDEKPGGDTEEPEREGADADMDVADDVDHWL